MENTHTQANRYTNSVSSDFSADLRFKLDGVKQMLSSTLEHMNNKAEKDLHLDVIDNKAYQPDNINSGVTKTNVSQNANNEQLIIVTPVAGSHTQKLHEYLQKHSSDTSVSFDNDRKDYLESKPSIDLLSSGSVAVLSSKQEFIDSSNELLSSTTSKEDFLGTSVSLGSSLNVSEDDEAKTKENHCAGKYRYSVLSSDVTLIYFFYKKPLEKIGLKVS